MFGRGEATHAEVVVPKEAGWEAAAVVAACLGVDEFARLFLNISVRAEREMRRKSGCGFGSGGYGDCSRGYSGG